MTTNALVANKTADEIGRDGAECHKNTRSAWVAVEHNPIQRSNTVNKVSCQKDEEDGCVVNTEQRKRKEGGV